MATDTSHRTRDPRAAVVSQIDADDAHTGVELIEILAHCRAVTASAAYRMLQAASLIHQEREEEYFTEVAAARSGELTSVRQFDEAEAAARSGCVPRTDFGPDGLERATAEVGAVLNLAPRRAREIITAGSALRHRLPLTGHALATGRIELPEFLLAVARTHLCEPATIVDIDAHIAQELFARPPMARQRFTVMVDDVIGRLDPDALLRRRERAAADRGVTIRPDRYEPGQGRVSATLPMTDAAELGSALTAMANGPHSADPRSSAQRRADALLAMARGQRHLGCLCPQCGHDSAQETDESSGTTPECADETAPEPDLDVDPSTVAPCQCSPQARPMFHIVVNLSTLIGLDDAPGYLDGHGVVDADTMRSLLADAEREFIRPQGPAGESMGYTPSRKLQSLVRSGELCCTFPGCSAPAWRTDLDHTRPFDHRSRRRGGQTVRGNLKPLCRFHHRIKTFTAWRDHQEPLGAVVFESPTGHMFFGNAYTGTDIFTALRSPPAATDHPARTHLEALRVRQRDIHREAVGPAGDPPPPPF